MVVDDQHPRTVVHGSGSVVCATPGKRSPLFWNECNFEQLGPELASDEESIVFGVVRDAVEDVDAGALLPCLTDAVTYTAFPDTADVMERLRTATGVGIAEEDQQVIGQQNFNRGAVGQPSLAVAGQRLAQVQAFADETTTALSEMTARIEQVASALGTLDGFALRTTERVQIMSEGLSAVASSGSRPSNERVPNSGCAFATGFSRWINSRDVKVP